MNILSSSLLLATTLFASSVAGWNPAERDCSEIPLCLTSFKWCSTEGDGCMYPDGVYPPSVNPKTAVHALVMEDYNYTISWKTHTQNRDTPVTVRWSSSGDYDDPWSGFDWETNTTDSQIIFNPSEILRSFPLPSSPNITRYQAEYWAKRDVTNILTIRQPDLDTLDGSSQFIVGDEGFTETFLRAQKGIGHRDEYARWRLGVGVGVGLGAPLLMVLTGVGTWIVAKRRLGGSDGKAVEMSPGRLG